MSEPSAALTELIDAAEVLIRNGSTATNRTRLRQALNALPREALPTTLPATRTWSFSPAVIAAITRAGTLADASNDLFIRTQHLDFALKEQQQHPPNQ